MKNTRHETKMWVRVGALILAILLVFGVVYSAVIALAEEEAPPERDHYRLDIEVLLEQQTARVSQTVDYTNRTGGPLSGVMFCVYANILRRQAATPVEADRITDAFPEGYAPGGVDFIGVRVNGEAADWGVQGDSELFLRVACELAPGETARFGFEFYVLLPVYSGAMGVGDLTWRLVNFYPVAAAWDDTLGEFILSGYTAMCEPLAADAADYDATITLPETWTLAAPGEIRASAGEGDAIRYGIRAEGVRELALVFSRKLFAREGETAAGTAVRALANTPEGARRLLRAALPAMDWLEETFGAYPWPALTLVETEYLYDGLSHPGVIQVSTGLMGLMSGERLAKATAGLCARQYFTCVVGSTRERAPWLSEALSEYAALMYFEARDGEAGYHRLLRERTEASLNVTIPGGVTVDSGTERFTSRMEFEIVVVDRGIAVLHELRRAMGADVFREALSEYVRRMWLGRATASDFLSAMNDVSGRRWDEYLYGQMHNISDYTINDLL